MMTTHFRFAGCVTCTAEDERKDMLNTSISDFSQIVASMIWNCIIARETYVS